MTTPANPNPPSQGLLYSPYQPTPQDYADALDQLGKQAQTGIRTPGALASNLIADALLQYGQGRAQQARTAGDASPFANDGSFLNNRPPGAIPGLVPLRFAPDLAGPEAAP